jgi:hypothetical protein
MLIKDCLLVNLERWGVIPWRLIYSLMMRSSWSLKGSSRDKEKTKGKRPSLMKMRLSLNLQSSRRESKSGNKGNIETRLINNENWRNSSQGSKTKTKTFQTLKRPWRQTDLPLTVSSWTSSTSTPEKPHVVINTYYPLPLNVLIHLLDLLIEVSREHRLLPDLLDIVEPNTLGLITVVTNTDLGVPIPRGIILVVGAGPTDDLSTFSAVVLSEQGTEVPIAGLTVLDYVIWDPVGTVLVQTLGVSSEPVLEVFCWGVSLPLLLTGGIMSQDEALVERVSGCVLTREADVLEMGCSVWGDDHTVSLLLQVPWRLVMALDAVHSLLHTDSEGPLYLPSQVIDLLDTALIGVESLETHEVLIILLPPEHIGFLRLLSDHRPSPFVHLRLGLLVLPVKVVLE